MSLLRQIEANRRNALKSTGPTTAEGKQRSRRNAIRHGLTAETVIAAFEDAEDYEAFQASVISDYDAETAVERELVLRLASVLWRLRRSTLIETALFELAAANSDEQDKSSPAEDHSKNKSEAKRRLLTAVPESNIADGIEPGFSSKEDIANSFLRLAALSTHPHHRLSRYEQMLWRQARQLVVTLERSQRRRQQSDYSRFRFASLR